MFLVCELYPGLIRGIQAVGQTKWQQILTSIVVLLPIPIGIGLYKFDYPHYAIIYVMLIAQIVSAGISIYFSKKYYDLPILTFMRFVALSILIFIGSYMVGKYIDNAMLTNSTDIFRFIVVSAISDILFVSAYYLFCFNKNEKNMIQSLINSLLKKIIRK